MTNLYVDMVEQIILEMKATLPKAEHLEVDHEYFVWLDFLRKIKPHSTLLNTKEDTAKEYKDIREIMVLAEGNNYPTWYIQPCFSELDITISYRGGELQDVHSENNVDMTEVWSVPRHIPDFAGIIKGILNADKSFIAYDIEMPLGFLQKMELLQSMGFTPCEYVLFPTNKIMSISSNTLEVSLLNFISKSRETGLPVDGVVMVSDLPLLPGNCTRIIFKFNSIN